ncbi:MAG: carboxymuconolactone decarboxylase family protein [Natronosporangium sp.]
MCALVDHLHPCPLEPRLRILVHLRASQINGCAFCLELHTREARAAGSAQEQLDLLARRSHRRRVASGLRGVLRRGGSLAAVVDLSHHRLQPGQSGGPGPGCGPRQSTYARRSGWNCVRHHGTLGGLSPERRRSQGLGSWC